MQPTFVLGLPLTRNLTKSGWILFHRVSHELFVMNFICLISNEITSSFQKKKMERMRDQIMFFRFIHFHVMKQCRFGIKNTKKSSCTADSVYIYI
jgi:hypothetical protein